MKNSRRPFLRNSALIMGSLAALESPLTSSVNFMASNHVLLTSKRQLFLDSYLIERMDGVHRTLHQPKRFQGNPVLRADRPWEKSVMINGAPSVVYDPKTKTFKMWYFTYTTVDEKTREFGESYLPSYATSKDGIHWEKPNLGLVEYAGTKQNSLLPWESQIVNGCSNVLYDARDPDPLRRYKSLYHSYRRVNDTRLDPGLYISFSPDGIHWNDYPENPVLDGAFNSPTAKVHDTHTILGWDNRLARYVAFLRPSLASGGGLRVIGVSTSSDFIRWTEPGKQMVLRPDNQDLKGTEFYGMPVMLYEDVYVGLIWLYHNDPYWPWPKGVSIPEEKLERQQQTMDTQLATSRDVLRWERSAKRETFMPVGPPETWDDGCIYPTAPVIVGDEIWIYYGGMNMRHTKESLSTAGMTIRGKRREAAVGLAKVRMDGFVSLDAGPNEGTLLTKPVQFSGVQLWLNLDASRGSIAMEILDEDLRPIPGFSRADAIPQRTNAIGQKVMWKSGSSMRSLLGRAVRLKFYLRDAELYSFWFSS